MHAPHSIIICRGLICTHCCLGYSMAKHTVYSGISVVVELPPFFHGVVSAEKPRHRHYKVAYALCPSAIGACNGGNILEERGCEVCQHQSCFKLNCKVPAEWIAFQMQQAMATHIQSRSESDLIPRAIQRHNPLIDKAHWGEMRVKEKKGSAKSMEKSIKKKEISRYSQAKAEKRGKDKERKAKG